MSKRKAAKKTAKMTDVAQERAAEIAERAGALAQDTAHDLAELLRDSEAIQKAQLKGAEVADLARAKWTDAELDKRLAELTDLAKAKWSDAELDKRAAEIAKQVRETDAAKEAAKRAKDMTDSSLASVGGWLAASKAADRMGISPKRRVPAFIWALLGLVVGFAASKALAQKSDGEVRDDLAAAADRLAARAPHPAGTVLADTIRATLQGDPRTADLRQININVAEGTVFVRGSIPSGIDTDAVRSVIESVPGVEDVDLQLSPAL
jgi:hypothetical protein